MTNLSEGSLKRGKLRIIPGSFFKREQYVLPSTRNFEDPEYVGSIYQLIALGNRRKKEGKEREAERIYLQVEKELSAGRQDTLDRGSFGDLVKNEKMGVRSKLRDLLYKSWGIPVNIPKFGTRRHEYRPLPKGMISLNELARDFCFVGIVAGAILIFFSNLSVQSISLSPGTIPFNWKLWLGVVLVIIGLVSGWFWMNKRKK